MNSPLLLVVGPRFFMEKLFTIFLNVFRFDCTAFVVSRKVGIPKTSLTTPFRWLSFTVLNRSVIVVQSKYLVALFFFFVVTLLFWIFFVVVRAFVIWMSQISSSFSLKTCFFIPRYQIFVFVCYHIFMTSPLWLAFGPQSICGGLFTHF